MYKKIIMVAVVILMATLLATPSMAKDHGIKKGPSDSPGKSAMAHEHFNNAPANIDDIRNNHSKDKFADGEKGPSGPAGHSNIGHLYLYEKINDGSDDWPIVEDGMWGKMKYNLSGPTFDFVFNGHGLPAGQEFTLIYYPDPWPGNGLICLGSGTVIEDEDGVGNIHIAGSVDTGDLPAESDANYGNGAKIFLVPTGDVDCVGQKMTGWSGDGANLYEGALITFDDTDGITTGDAKTYENKKGPSGPAGQSNIGHLYFYEKTNVDGEVNNGSTDWPIVDDGMWGKMKYNLSGATFDFVFNGHRLPVGEEFTLILHPNSEDGTGLICLGSGIVVEDEDDVQDGLGSIHIAESIDIGDLPPVEVEDYQNGAELILVPSSDVNCEGQVMTGWTEGSNLYQGAPITYEDTDGMSTDDMGGE